MMELKMQGVTWRLHHYCLQINQWSFNILYYQDCFSNQERLICCQWSCPQVELKKLCGVFISNKCYIP